jgi:cytoskeleton protein RodZ
VPRADLALETPTSEASSKTEPRFPVGSDACRAGADLRAARERLGWDLPDVAAMLRIRSTYLEALESGRLSNLPGDVYAIGFLRSYATALGLDVEEVSRRFRAEAGDIPRHSELVFPVPLPERGLPAGALMLLGLILIGGAYIGWYRLSGEGRLPAETVPPVPARLAALVEAPAPVPVPVVPSDQRRSAAISVPTPPAPPTDEDIGLFEPRRALADNQRLPPPPPAAAPIEAMRMASIPGGTATTAIAMPVPQPIRPPDPEPQSATGSPARPDGARVVLRFTGDTWVQVRERGGDALVTKVMRAGETYPVPDRSNLILNTGNAGRIAILVDGTEVPSIGGPGSVRKEVPLDPDLLRSGMVPVSGRR